MRPWTITLVMDPRGRECLRGNFENWRPRQGGSPEEGIPLIGLEENEKSSNFSLQLEPQILKRRLSRLRQRCLTVDRHYLMLSSQVFPVELHVHATSPCHNNVSCWNGDTCRLRSCHSASGSFIVLLRKANRLAGREKWRTWTVNQQLERHAKPWRQKQPRQGLSFEKCPCRTHVRMHYAGKSLFGQARYKRVSWRGDQGVAVRSAAVPVLEKICAQRTSTAAKFSTARAEACKVCFLVKIAYKCCKQDAVLNDFSNLALTACLACPLVKLRAHASRSNVSENLMQNLRTRAGMQRTAIGSGARASSSQRRQCAGLAILVSSTTIGALVETEIVYFSQICRAHKFAKFAGITIIA